jgi:hypothetical protein
VVQISSRGATGGSEMRHVRAPWSLPSFAFLTSVAFVLVTIVDPTAAFALIAGVHTTVAPSVPTEPNQVFVSADGQDLSVDRNDFTTSKIRAFAPVAGLPDPGSAKAIGYEMVLARGWDVNQYNCLVSLWDRESHWNIYASNKTSGAYGIPQALPGSKMASAGADWQTNPATQIAWGLGYIAGRYGDPCGAWASSQSRGWY